MDAFLEELLLPSQFAELLAVANSWESIIRADLLQTMLYQKNNKSVNR